MVESRVAADIYRQRLTALGADYEALRGRYNEAVRKTAVTELLVKDGSLSVDLGILREALYATADYPGVTGTLTCSEYGDCSAPKIAVYQVGLDNIEDEVWPPAVV